MTTSQTNWNDTANAIMVKLSEYGGIQYRLGACATPEKIEQLPELVAESTRIVSEVAHLLYTRLDRALLPTARAVLTPDADGLSAYLEQTESARPPLDAEPRKFKWLTDREGRVWREGTDGLFRNNTNQAGLTEAQVETAHGPLLEVGYPKDSSSPVAAVVDDDEPFAGPSPELVAEVAKEDATTRKCGVWFDSPDGGQARRCMLPVAHDGDHDDWAELPAAPAAISDERCDCQPNWTSATCQVHGGAR